MDWGRDYYTFSDTNIEYIWKFLHARCTSGAGSTWGTGRPSGARAAAPQSPRTSWSAATSTGPTRRSACASRCSTGRASPWSSGPRRRGPCRPTWPRRSARRPSTAAWRTATGWRCERGDGRAFARVRARCRAGRLAVPGAVRRPGPGSAVEHRVIGWDEVSLEEGTGIVHIAPGCGAEDFELGKAHGLPVLTPVDESGRFYPEYGWLAGAVHVAVAGPRWSTQLRERSLLVERGRDDPPLSGVLAMPHSADLPGLRRLVHLGRGRSGSRCERRTARWSGRPPTWAAGWTTGSSTWRTGTSPGGVTTACRCRSTRAACGHLNVIGSRAELAERATTPLTGLRSFAGPGSTPSRSGARPATPEVGADRRGWRRLAGRRDRAVLHAGLGERGAWLPEGYATARRRG